MSSESVLLTDDDAVLREALADLLLAEGYEVRLAGTGAEALRFFVERPSDLVVTDVYMPDMDGIELIRALRRIAADVPILVMSGKQAHVDYLTMASEFGATAVIAKPFRGSEFCVAVGKCMERGAGG